MTRKAEPLKLVMGYYKVT